MWELLVLLWLKGTVEWHWLQQLQVWLCFSSVSCNELPRLQWVKRQGEMELMAVRAPNDVRASAET